MTKSFVIPSKPLASGRQMHQVYRAGGLTTEQATQQREASGRNAIDVRVPGRFESLVTEFSNFYYVPGQKWQEHTVELLLGLTSWKNCCFKPMENAQFTKLIQVFNSVAFLTYIAFTTWNIGLLWLLMTLGAGVYKGLVVTRPNQQRVAELAKVKQRCRVLRDGTWQELDASEIVSWRINKLWCKLVDTEMDFFRLIEAFKLHG